MKLAITESNPIVKFALEPTRIENALALDDTVFWGSLGQLQEASDPVVSELAARLHHRKLFKSLNLREMIAHELQIDSASEVVDRVAALTVEEITDWTDSLDTVLPRVILDSAQRVPYKEFQEDVGPLNQILIRSGPELVDIKSMSKIVDAIRPFKLLRAYISPDDGEARDEITRLVKVVSARERKDAR